MKKFDKQKQEIIDAIYDGYGKATILEKVKQLQPPKPTCATCEHYNSEWSSFGICKKKIRDSEPPPEYEGCNLVGINFGCIHHSDWEAKDE